MLHRKNGKTITFSCFSQIDSLYLICYSEFFSVLLFNHFIFNYSSYDTRGAHSEQPAHWIDMDVLQNRATFNIVRDKVDGELLLKPVTVNMFVFYNLLGKYI